jgi:ubiquinone/menaquinone biosynthesis C-methylase UbiE
VKNNRIIYESEKVVKNYEKHHFLFGAEKKTLSLIIEQKIRGSMLDVGVGAGRTTSFFAQHFDSYVGLDFSDPMIERCKEKFRQKNISFVHGDVRFLDKYFQKDTFDFVLFSFNGLDYVNYDDRLLSLGKIKTVLKPNGIFVFSSHNIYNIPRLFSFQWPRNPFKLFKEYKRWIGVQKVNKPMNELMTMDYSSIIDGDMDFQMECLYIKPEFQLMQLKEIGFTGIKMFSVKDGYEMPEDSKTDDAWVYYVAVNQK